MECSYKNVSSKLSKSYVMQSLKVTSVNILRSMYFAKFHLHLKYRIVLGGEWMGKLQKKVMRLISNIGRATSCRDVFKRLNILPVTMETVHYIKLNIGRFKQNSLRHHYKTQQRSDLQSQICRPDVSKKRVKSTGIKI
jgi:hypothetical protein